MKVLLEALAPGSEDLALARAIDSGRIPRHIAIIMDGNGRWAQKRGHRRVFGHVRGSGGVKEIVK
ncbi:MAG: undecaprenyl diphosphate synthase family protein, partial [Bryobacteraceae bacterium]